MSARRAWVTSIVAHAAAALALRVTHWGDAAVTRPAPPPETMTMFDVAPPPPAEPAQPPTTAPTVTAPTPTAHATATHATPPTVARPEAPPAPSEVTPPPTAVTPPTAPPPVNGRDILRGMHGDVMNLAVSQGMLREGPPPSSHPERDLFPGSHGDVEARARDASAGYVRRELASTHQHEAPGVRDYYWGLRRRMIEQWRPGVQREPSLVDALVAGVAGPMANLGAVQQSMVGGAVAPGALGAMNDAQNTRNNVQPMSGGIVDMARANERRTRADIVVDQDAQGAVVAIRVLRSSHIASFDAEALRAVREALPLQSPVAMPGGRRSLWSFEVVASRDPIMPGVGLEFDESTGWFEVHVPGRLHLRSRVHLESTLPLGAT